MLEGFLVFIMLCVFVGFIAFRCVRICSEWERKVVLSLGRYAGVRGPGLFLLFPWETTPCTIDMRMMTSSFLAEQSLSRDNVPVNVDTILYWKVIDPKLAVLEVEDYRAAVMGAAQTALRDIIGRTSLSSVLSDRANLDLAMTEVLDAQTEPWGIKVQSVQMRDIKIPDALQDAMSRVAQAEREGLARKMLGQSEVTIAQQFADAGKVYMDNPIALHLRGMNMLFEVMKVGGTQTVIVPSNAVDSMNFGSMAGLTAMARSEGMVPQNRPPQPPPPPPRMQ